MAYIELHFPDGRIEHFELHQNSMTIGRDASCEIILHESAISRKHAMLKKHRGRWVITDLGARNKTFFNNRAIKSHVLANNDEIHLGSLRFIFFDPTGASDAPSNETIYLRDTRPERGKTCPACKAPMTNDAVICLKCGFNTQTGKRLEVVLEETSIASAIHSPIPASNETSAKKKETKHILSAKQKAQIIDIYLPASFITLFLILSIMYGGISGPLVGSIGIVLRVGFLLLAMAIAAKIGEFGFGPFGTAILKVFGICSFLATASIILGWIWYVLFSIVILGGLLKLFFDLDFFELFIIIMIVMILQQTLLMIIMGAIGSFFAKGGGV